MQGLQKGAKLKEKREISHPVPSLCLLPITCTAPAQSVSGFTAGIYLGPISPSSPSLNFHFPQSVQLIRYSPLVFGIWRGRASGAKRNWRFNLDLMAAIWHLVLAINLSYIVSWSQGKTGGKKCCSREMKQSRRSFPFLTPQPAEMVKYRCKIYIFIFIYVFIYLPTVCSSPSTKRQGPDLSGKEIYPLFPGTVRLSWGFPLSR